MQDNAFTAQDLHGKSSDRTFAGALSFARRPYSKDVSKADAVVWGIPLDTATSNRPGARFGPRGIRAASAIMDNDPQYPFGAYIFDELSVVDYGDCHLGYARQGETAQMIVEQAEAIINAPNAPYLMSLGGDHFVTGALLKAHAAKFGPLSLVQFDAHQDTWDDGGTFAVDHGAFITTAVREGWIDPGKSIQIGIRTHAPEDFGIEIIDGLTLDTMDVEAIAERIYERTGGTNVYMTFDIDCLDPAYAPGTGTPVSGGPSTATTLRLLRACKNLQVVGSDVVEVAPAYDHAEITSIAGSTIAMYMLGNLWERRRG
jgi:agmatinase